MLIEGRAVEQGKSIAHASRPSLQDLQKVKKAIMELLLKEKRDWLILELQIPFPADFVSEDSVIIDDRMLRSSPLY